jgi:hypothetical protein
MATERTRNAVILGTVILAVALVLGGLAFLAFKMRAHAAQHRALEKLKAANPVEYYIQHTPLTQTGDDLRNALVGTWELTGAKSRRTGGFVTLMSPQNYHKTFTLTNWAIVTCDNNSNVLYTASGHYTLQGDNYTESIEAATGQMTQYLGAHPSFKIRLDGDTYYQMSAGRNANPLEEMWQRVQ